MGVAYTSGMFRWRLRLLGEVALEGEGVRGSLERKTAALLAYVALEGPSPRSRLAGLLWPDVPEERARGNLRQLFRRLREAAGGDLFASAEPVRLCAEVGTDVSALQHAVLSGRDTDPTLLRGDLLAVYDYDDCSELFEWLLAQRERIRMLRSELIEAEIGRLERGGDYAGAARWAERLLELDPLSEEAHRRAMRLYYLSGDRPAALQAYARCRELLSRELRVAPLPETAALARDIEQGAIVPDVDRRRKLPLALFHPPVLAGRETAWAQLEAAWAQGQAIFIRGGAGVGKTRLMRDFATTKGLYGYFVARPGDAGVPYAMHARGWRQLLATFPDLELEPWVRRELSRLLPELSDDPLPPLTSEADKLRLFEAKGETIRAAMKRGWVAVVVDDLHYIDAASFEAGNYLIGKFLPAAEPGAPRSINSYRSGEIPPEIEARVEEMAACGLAAFVDLEPLEVRGVEQLLGGLGLPTPPSFGASLLRYTGGNPLFIVETLKSLAEADRLEEGLPSQLPPPERVGAVITGRLQRLSPDALRLVRAAAVMQESFNLESAARVLEMSPLPLSEALAELEAAQIFSHDRFSHDLVFETVTQTTPGPLRRLLHGRTAECLESAPVNPARVAQHYLAAGDEAKAVPWLIRAAEAAETALRLTDAVDFYLQAADIEEALEGRQRAFDLFLRAADLLRHFDVGERYEPLLAKLSALARSEKRRAQLEHIRSEYLSKVGRGEEAEAAARQGYKLAQRLAEPRLEATLLGDLATALWLQGRLREACDIYRGVLAATEVHGSEAEFATDLANFGVLLDHLDAHREALTHHRRAARLLEQLGDKVDHIAVLNNLSISQLQLGLVHGSVETLEHSLELCEGIEGADNYRLFALNLLGACYVDLADFRLARTCFERAQVYASHAAASYAAGTFLRQEASLLFYLGAFEAADDKLAVALAQDNLPAQHRAAAWTLRARLLTAQGKPATRALAEAERLLSTEDRKLLLGNFWLAKAETLPAEEALQLAQRALELATAHDLGGLRFGAETRCAQALLAQDAPEQARQHMDVAMDLLSTHHPVDFYLGEVLFTHYRVLESLGDRGARAQLAGCLEWLLEVANAKTPPEHRDSFLRRNPVNRAISGAAARSGLNIQN